MVVYHLNIFIGTVLCVPHVITNVTVALMFEILYPRQESNLQFTRLKLVVSSIPPRGYLMVRWDSNPHPFGQLRPNAFTI